MRPLKDEEFLHDGEICRYTGEETRVGKAILLRTEVVESKRTFWRDVTVRPAQVGELTKAMTKFLAERDNFRARMLDDLLQRSDRLPSKPDIFIFDLDGTLADVSGRDPLDASTCDEDPQKTVVVTIAKALQAFGFGIVCTSGRQEKGRAKTHNFLIHQCRIEEYLALYMRPDGDPRPDDVVKEEILLTKILPRFTVVGAFDDRESVCQLWIRYGIPTFQVR